MMIDPALVRRKLSRLNMYRDQLKAIAGHSFEEYVSNPYLKYTAERLIQLIVECATDINSHVIIESGQRPAEDYASSFVRAAELGLLPPDLANRIKGSAGMRNILVHEYLDIDDKKVYGILPAALSDYQEYIRQVDQFLDRLEKKEKK
jgi:uncharacterized protein YutE (UPF0331/DUF86 family)